MRYSNSNHWTNNWRHQTFVLNIRHKNQNISEHKQKENKKPGLEKLSKVSSFPPRYVVGWDRFLWWRDIALALDRSCMKILWHRAPGWRLNKALKPQWFKELSISHYAPFDKTCYCLRFGSQNVRQIYAAMCSWNFIFICACLEEYGLTRRKNYNWNKLLN